MDSCKKLVLDNIQAIKAFLESLKTKLETDLAWDHGNYVMEY